MSSDIVLQTLANIVLDMPAPPIPVTTLSARAAKGALSARLTSAAGFPSGGLLLFHDDSAERPVKIASVQAEGVTLTTTGDGRNGLEFEHAQGARVYANLFKGRTILDGPLVANGSLVLCLVPRMWDSVQVTVPKGYENVYVIQLLLIMRLQPGQGATIDPNLWALEQQDRARVTFEQLVLAIKGKLPLRQDNGYNLDLGMSGQPVPHFHIDMSALTGELDVLEFQSAMEVTLREREPTPPGFGYNGFL